MRSGAGCSRTPAATATTRCTRSTTLCTPAPRTSPAGKAPAWSRPSLPTSGTSRSRSPGRAPSRSDPLTTSRRTPPAGGRRNGPPTALPNPGRRQPGTYSAAVAQRVPRLPRHGGASESPWVAWRLHRLETRMESCRRTPRRGSRPRVATARRRRPPRYGWSARCALSWEPSTAPCSASPSSSGTAPSRCGPGCARPTSMRVMSRG